ncbi:hypothetical protein BO94DRAFT_453567 [Aspergillus sclerotioniger CBS 115572]|uniref:SRR1-like domain-containing protein n=1 Tax=Aspergillus sclerotioniger CBS 115572 TaxID=1450535 RepID=A0A317XFQ0_9EURO|nr:hypothetical protein BO94DRAFT_453567 [Aspergillus sclerotioniger CBS 115572]PWY96682.1 hypothetical protein BO94DRAFT_453567 [Aspergillus sclerotioniger CBS 115572]
MCESALSPESPAAETDEPVDCLSLYHDLQDDGKPFFEKELISNVYKQIQERKAGEVITIKGIDGSLVDFKVRTGEVVEIRDGVALVAGKPYIDYLPIQCLDGVAGHFPHLGYLNMRIYHRLRYRSLQTGQYIHETINPPLTTNLAEFLSFLYAWESTNSCRHIRATLESLPEFFGPVTKIVGFACNSIVNPQGCLPEKQRISFQHGFLLTLRDVLRRKTGNSDIKILVQDPAYTESDVELLKEFNIVVVEDPVGFLEVDEETFVFSCSPNVPVRQIVLDMVKPVGMVWNKVLAETAIFNITDPWDLSIHRTINRHYDTYVFPHDSRNFGVMGLYLRCVGGDVPAEEYERRDLETLVTVRGIGQYANQVHFRVAAMNELLDKVPRIE